MNTDRLFQVLLLELTSDKMKFEDILEQTINSNDDINTKILSMKSALSGINNVEASIAKLQAMLNNNNNENNNEQKNN